MHRFIKWHNAVAAASVDLEQIRQHGDHTGNLQFHCHLDLSCPGTNNKYMHTQTDRQPFHGLFFQDNLDKPALESLNQSGF